MEEFDRVLEDKFNSQYSNNMKSLADKYPTRLVYFNLEDELFKANFNKFIYN